VKIYLCLLFFLLIKIILASNTASQNAFTHGQVISFGDGQQAIIVPASDQSGGHQSILFNYATKNKNYYKN
jgi:hypothetical protein